VHPEKLVISTSFSCLTLGSCRRVAMQETDAQEKLNEAIKIVEDYLYFLSSKPNLSYCTENERAKWEEGIIAAYAAFIKMYHAYKHELKLHYTDTELAFFPAENHKHVFPNDHINTYAKGFLEQLFLSQKLVGGILNLYNKINCKTPFPKVQQVLSCLKELRDKVEWESETPVPPAEPTKAQDKSKLKTKYALLLEEGTWEFKAQVGKEVNPLNLSRNTQKYLVLDALYCANGNWVSEEELLISGKIQKHKQKETVSEEKRDQLQKVISNIRTAFEVAGLERDFISKKDKTRGYKLLVPCRK
jgi:hypothetical protein